LCERKIVKKFFKWMGIVVAAVAGLALLGLGYLYVASERELARQYTMSDEAVLAIPTDALEIEAGQRIAQLAGCMHCHGDNLAGTVVDDIPNLVRLVAPNISAMLPRYDDAQLATVLRKGVKPDGKSVLFMPSEMFRHLSDEDLARVIAFLRTKPAVPDGITETTTSAASATGRIFRVWRRSMLRRWRWRRAIRSYNSRGSCTKEWARVNGSSPS
jgi:cytochrome c553